MPPPKCSTRRRPALQSGLTAWTFGALPELMEVKVGAGTTVGFPALVDMGESVRLTAFDTEDKARAEHRRGMARLFALQLAAQVKAIEKLPGLRELALQFMALGTEKELREQLIAVTLERTCLMDPLPAEESAFATRREAARGRILLVAQEILRLLGDDPGRTCGAGEEAGVAAEGLSAGLRRHRARSSPN